MEIESLVVRPEYERAARKFVELLRVLGKNPSDELNNQIILFCRAVECVDRNYDGIPARDERNIFKQNVGEALRGKSSNLTDEVANSLSKLRNELETADRTEDFIQCADKIFEKGELLREIEDVNKAIVLIMEEGSLTADLMMLAIDNQDETFAAFMREAGEIGKLFDDVIDLRGDLKAGERSLTSPNEFYLKAIPLIFYKVLKALLQFPHYLKPIFVFKLFKAIPQYARRT